MMRARLSSLRELLLPRRRCCNSRDGCRRAGRLRWEGQLNNREHL